MAHRPRHVDPDLPFGPKDGPHDGDPVWLAAPCARLRAGYLCECGFGFEYAEGRPDDWSLARVVPLEDETMTTYREEGWVLFDPHGWVEHDDDRLLWAQIDGIPVGTVVERHGLGVAPLFEPIAPQPGHEPWWALDATDPYWASAEPS